MNDAATAATSVQGKAGSDDANVEDMAILPDDDEVVRSQRFTVNVSEEMLEDIKSIGDFWSEHAVITGKGRRRKWKIATVAQFFIEHAVDEFWKSSNAKHLRTPDERRARLEELIRDERAKVEKKKK